MAPSPLILIGVILLHRRTDFERPPLSAELAAGVRPSVAVRQHLPSVPRNYDRLARQLQLQLASLRQGRPGRQHDDETYAGGFQLLPSGRMPVDSAEESC